MITPSPPPPELPEGRYVDVPGARLWTVDTGGDESSVVVLLHAAVGATPHWSYQVVPLHGAGFRVIAYDRRGSGRSVSTAEDPPDADPSAADCLALLAALGVERAHLVGIAQGGRIATEVALARPGLAASLTLVASNAGIRFPSAVPDAPALMPRDFTSYPTWFTELGAPYRSVDPAGTLRWLALGGHHPAGLSGPVVKLAPSALTEIEAPVLLLGGDADPFTPPPVLRRLRELRPDARLEILTECGHSPQWERPELFNSTLVDFLRA